MEQTPYLLYFSIFDDAEMLSSNTTMGNNRSKGGIM
jgi:hypothetical protein